MTQADRLLQEAHRILKSEVAELRRTLSEKECQLAELNRLLANSSPVPPRVTISEAVQKILQDSDRPLSAKEITEKVRQMGISQRAANPHNSILALLHHLKKQPGSRVKQTAEKRWYWNSEPKADR